MTIRKMTKNDLSACAEILIQVYNNTLWQGGWTHETALEYLTDFFDMKKFAGFVVTLEDSIIGAVFAHEKVWWNRSEVFVEEMFISPEHQRKGIGSLLIREIETYIKENSLCGITLSTNRYAPAPAFYRKNGFYDCEHVLFMAKETK